MQTKKNKFSFGLQQLIYLVLLLGFITAVAQPFHHNIPVATSSDEQLMADNMAATAVETTGNPETGREKESKEAFLKAYTVFMHPRCMNCHPAGDVPLQGDDSHLHLQGVKRGPYGKGLYAMKCKNCHQDANLKGPNLPPGSPEWKLPPASKKMVFKRLSMEEADVVSDGRRHQARPRAAHAPAVRTIGPAGTSARQRSRNSSCWARSSSR